MENEELLRKLTENSNKSLKLQKLRTGLVFAILIFVVITVLMVIPKVVSTLDKVQSAAVAVEDTVSRAQTTMDEIDKMADALTTTGDGMNALLNENGQTLTDSLDKMANIDFDGLNKGIQDLQDAVGPFANFMNKFR